MRTVALIVLLLGILLCGAYDPEVAEAKPEGVNVARHASAETVQGDVQEWGEGEVYEAKGDGYGVTNVLGIPWEVYLDELRTVGVEHTPCEEDEVLTPSSHYVKAGITWYACVPLNTLIEEAR